MLHAKTLPGNPGAYPRASQRLDSGNGHTLAGVIEETEVLTGRTIERIYVDTRYRGHNVPQPWRVFRSGQKRGVFGINKKELRRRSAIEAAIGHMKTDGHLGRNYPKGRHGDHANANGVLPAVGYNLRLILTWLRLLLRLILAAIRRALMPRSVTQAAC